jgi:pimeloyl-ACP methyl ester carboxylesterase
MTMPGKRMQWYRLPLRNVDTVVFVHGFKGHFRKSWGAFPRLLDEDPDLPTLDILLWGYRSKLFGKVHDIKTEGKHLTSHLQMLIQEGLNIFLVGHSMGGIVLLKGLVDRMTDNHAQLHPCKSVAWITLFASPLRGTLVAVSAKRMLAKFSWRKGSDHKQLKDLVPEGELIALMEQVKDRIYQPAAIDAGRRLIPIRVVVATNDSVVDTPDKDLDFAEFNDLPPVQLDESHRSINEPKSHNDVRYWAFTRDLQERLTDEFVLLCQRATDASLFEQEREFAVEQIISRYSKIIDDRVQEIARGRAKLLSKANESFMGYFLHGGAQLEKPAFDVANRARALAKRENAFR